jgi:hypothetical protein
MSFRSDILTRRDNIATELKNVRTQDNHAYVLRLWEELRRCNELLQSSLTDATSADDFGPFEHETRGVT